MRQRNWMQLSRKLVDRYDMTFTLQGMTDAINEATYAIFGEGVAITAQHPNPFPITLSGALLGGSVGYGTAYDNIGNFTSINANTTSSPLFSIPTANPTFPRWDLLVIQYTQVGDTLVPKPSDPITTIDLNLHDDFTLYIRPGTPSITPAYPTKQASDIILGGIQVPPGVTLGTQCFLDLSIRETSYPDVFLPVFKQEALSGVVDGSNTVFSTSLIPINNSSVLAFLDSEVRTLSTEFTVVGQIVTFSVAPQVGQIPYCWYVVASPHSTNPMSIQQETPLGVVDGVNATFNLTGRPANQISTFVFVDGLIEDASHWALAQSAGISSIVFGPSYIPAAGESVYVAYFINPATVGISNIGGGGGGSGAYVTYGTLVSPLTITAGAGIVANNNQRQLQFVKSSGGPIAITANPQISPGTTLGEEMLLQGTSLTDYIVLNDGNGLSLNGSISLGSTDYKVLSLYWDGAVWSEISRR